MSCSPCSYSYTTAPQFLMTGQHPSSSYPTPTNMPPDTLVSQTHPGSSVCSIPAYDSRLLTATYPRLGDIYGPGYPDPVATAAATYMSGLTPNHPAVLYPTSLTSPYDMKDPRTAWAALPQAAGYPCDPTFAAYSPYGDRFDTVDSEARRRNATRETTSTLKAWLNEHRKNPYPTKGEKIMLAIITKMTLTQVSTWFANARRRLKKENKMTWEPRNKTGDDLDDVSVDEDDEKEDQNEEDPKPNGEAPTDQETVSKESTGEKGEGDATERKSETSNFSNVSPPSSETEHVPLKLRETEIASDNAKQVDSSSKPKIWSLAQTATSESPPSSRKQSFDPSGSPVDFKRLRRMVYPEPYHHPADIYHRPLPHSSAESSLSSPPLWKASEHMHCHGDSRGPHLDSGDMVSVSPSSSGSPAVVVSSSLEVSGTSGQPQPILSPGLGYNRLLGCRLLPDNSRHHPLDSGHYYSPPASSMASSLDLRTLHSAFLRTPPFGYPVGFGPTTNLQQRSHSPGKTKPIHPDEGPHSDG